MATIQKFEPQYEDDVLKLLEYFNNKNVTITQWKSIWNNSWINENETPGYILLDNNNVVGFLGLIYGNKIINNKNYRICNLTSWYVKPEYRSESLKLLMQVLKYKNHILTNLTPSKRIRKIVQKLGFNKIDNDIILLLNIPLFIKKNNILTYNIDAAYFNSSLLEIYNQNINYNIRFVLMKNDKEDTVFAYKIRKKKGVKYIYIMYISNPIYFANNSFAVRNFLFRNTFVPLIMIDSRLLEYKKIPFSIKIAGLFPKYFKTDLENIENIDNLNSEFVLLNI